MKHLHVGAETVLNTDDIIAIIPRDTALASRDTRRALDDAIGGARVVFTPPPLPPSRCKSARRQNLWGWIDKIDKKPFI